jgi:hypothetical protein
MSEELRELENMLIDASNSGKYESYQITQAWVAFMKVHHYSQERITIEEAYKLIEQIGIKLHQELLT